MVSHKNAKFLDHLVGEEAFESAYYRWNIMCDVNKIKLFSIQGRYLLITKNLSFLKNFKFI